MLDYFHSLGSEIATAWLAVQRDEREFPAIVMDCLERRPFEGNITAGEIVDWIFAMPHTFPQPVKPQFGEPSCTLFSGEGFYIEALFWLNGSTAIHQHSFSGVFTPIHGSSVHSRFRFEAAEAANSDVVFGELRHVESEHLRVGELRKILPGDEFIHQLFHLEPPSITIVIRTSEEERFKPQYSYFPPNTAYNPFSTDHWLDRQIELLRIMVLSDFDDANARAISLVRSGNPMAALRVLQLLHNLDAGEAIVDSIRTSIRELPDGRRAILERIIKAAEGQARLITIAALRAAVSTPDLRYFLALLMLMPDRDTLFAMLSDEYPQTPPAEKALQLTEALMETLQEERPAAVEVDFDDVNREIVRALLAGSDQKQFVASLSEVFDAEDVEAQESELIEQARRLAQSLLLRPLFVPLGLG